MVSYGPSCSLTCSYSADMLTYCSKCGQCGDSGGSVAHIFSSQAQMPPLGGRWGVGLMSLCCVCTVASFSCCDLWLAERAVLNNCSACSAVAKSQPCPSPPITRPKKKHAMSHTLSAMRAAAGMSHVRGFASHGRGGRVTRTIRPSNRGGARPCTAYYYTFGPPPHTFDG